MKSEADIRQERPAERVPRRDFLEMADLSRQELLALLDRAGRIEAGREPPAPLAGKSLVMIFRKSSTRTRVSFEIGMFQLGGHAVFLSDRDSQIGRGEPISDTARVLSGYADGILIRTFAHEEVLEMARYSTVPVINGLTDLHHPTQVLADVHTIREEFGELEGLRVAWIGDGNNMANSWIDAAARFGFELRLACPEGYDPDAGVLQRGRREGKVLLVREPREAAEGAHVVTTDVWTSMGQEEEAEARARAFEGFFVDAALMGRAHPNAIFLHCLPAHRGEEVSAEVIDGPASRVFREAENLLHVRKALLLELLE